MKNKKYLDYNLGENQLSSHIDAVHAQKPKADKYTGEIVLGVIQQVNASGIIATVSRTEMNINQPRNANNAPAVDEYRETIRDFIESKGILDKEGKLNRNYLHLAIHGMSDGYGTDFEIGISDGNSCSPEVIDWFKTKLQALSSNYKVDNEFPGKLAKIECHRKGDISSNYPGYGDLFNTIQVEINRDWRENGRTDLIKFFSDLILDFDKNF
jgi:hypothetical protein